MAFGENDFWNLGAPPGGMAALEPLPLRYRDEVVRVLAERNATRLQRILRQAAADAQPRYLYLPPGRFPLGMPEDGLLLPSGDSEGHADFVFPLQVTLMFGSSATLIPIRYTPDEFMGLSPAQREAFTRRHTLLPESEQRKVRIEIQGTVEADVEAIFDVYVDDPVADTTLREAGRILFRRDRVRELYPEWWGAVPLPEEGATLSRAKVRRTTAALQACIDAAYHQRGRLVRNVVSTYDESMRRYVTREAPTPQQLRASIPVVLRNDYLIDRPLRVGRNIVQAGGPATRLTSANGEETTRQAYTLGTLVPERGLVIRGECGPATRRYGAALIRAAEHFAPVDEGVQGTEVWSMLTVRTPSGVVVENVIFDAAERAARCVTIQVPGANGNTAQAHHNGFEGCEFRNAWEAAVRVGGEDAPSVSTTIERPDALTVAEVDPMLFVSGGTDISNIRFTRCCFVTGTRDAMLQPRVDPPFKGNPSKVGVWRHGLVLRAKESFGVELHGCTFEGPANPMILALGGRFSLQACAFRTDLVPNSAEPSPRFAPAHTAKRRWNGTDVYWAPPTPSDSRRLLEGACRRRGGSPRRPSRRAASPRGAGSFSARTQTTPWRRPGRRRRAVR